MYNVKTHHLYIPLSVHHPKSNLFLLPCIGPPLHSSSTLPLSSLLLTTILLSVSVSSFVYSVHLFLAFVLYPTDEWNHLVLILFCLISLGMILTHLLLNSVITYLAFPCTGHWAKREYYLPFFLFPLSPLPFLPTNIYQTSKLSQAVAILCQGLKSYCSSRRTDKPTELTIQWGRCTGKKGTTTMGAWGMVPHSSETLVAIRKGRKENHHLPKLFSGAQRQLGHSSVFAWLVRSFWAGMTLNPLVLTKQGIWAGVTWHWAEDHTLCLIRRMHSPCTAQS